MNDAVHMDSTEAEISSRENSKGNKVLLFWWEWEEQRIITVIV